MCCVEKRLSMSNGGVRPGRRQSSKGELMRTGQLVVVDLDSSNSDLGYILEDMRIK